MIKKSRKCNFCESEINIKEYRYKNDIIFVCLSHRRMLEKQYKYQYKIQIKEVSLKQAVLELVKDDYNKEDIMFILELNEKEFLKEINRLKNLVQFRSLFKKFSEPILPKLNPGEQRKNDFE